MSMLKQLREDDISIDLDSLSDSDLKKLYLKSQAVRSNGVQWGISKEYLNFEEALAEERLNFVSFSDTYKLGVRRLTLKECLLIESTPNCKYISSLWKH
jgi:hypothetical protein